MRALLFIFLGCIYLSDVCAQSVKVFWEAMPDTVVPYLSREMRSELLELSAKQFPASIKNRLDGTTIVDTLTDNFLSVKLTETSSMQIKRLAYRSDSIFCVVTSHFGPVCDSNFKLYMGDWKAIPADHAFDGSSLDIIKKSLVTKPDTMSQNTFEAIRLSIDPLFVKISLCPSQDNLVIEPLVDMLNKENKNNIFTLLNKKVFKWDGKMFNSVMFE